MASTNFYSVADSPLEGRGFELSVPPCKGPASLDPTLVDLRPFLLSRESSDTLAEGTEGSNPSCSSGESFGDGEPEYGPARQCPSPRRTIENRRDAQAGAAVRLGHIRER